MSDTDDAIRWIATQETTMRRRVQEWCAINTGTGNLAGLHRLTPLLTEVATSLGGSVEEIELPPRTSVDSNGDLVHTPVGSAIRVTRRPDAVRKVFVGIHMDTVYGPDHSFQEVTEIDGNTWRGPGVADAKGGLVVMFAALEALERSGNARQLGWEMLINPDEEIGSPGSGELFAAAARRTQVGLLFEPALPDGNLVGSRKGSSNYALVVRGRSAHVGRDIASGRNAIHAMAEFVVAANAMQAPDRGITVNVGKVEGGGPSNVVPDLAIARFNVRATQADDQPVLDQTLHALADDLSRRLDVRATLQRTAHVEPKLFNDASQRLFNLVAGCGKTLGLDLSWRPSGGVSDGNRLAANGLPVIDTLGVRGGNIHSSEEYISLDSLPERAGLTALLLLDLARNPLGAIFS